MRGLTFAILALLIYFAGTYIRSLDMQEKPLFLRRK